MRLMRQRPPRAPGSGANSSVSRSAEEVPDNEEGSDKSSWRKYFDNLHHWRLGEEDVFAVYTSGSPWNNLLLCLHGGGHTALSWCLVSEILRQHFFVAAYDCRGHGLTACSDEEDLSIVRLVEDCCRVVHLTTEHMERERALSAARGEAAPDTSMARAAENAGKISIRDRILLQSRGQGPSVILMGHSLGGAVATHAAATGKIANLQGLIVLDVVEGLALDNLASMERFIRNIPEEFPSEDEAISWALAHVLKNPKSARLSIPSQLRRSEQGWVWRTNLAATRKYWQEWFTGMSAKFLSARVGSGGKVLVLVGHEHLDRELTIGHMQGKYQLRCVPKSGHIIEEDQPMDVATAVIHFASRYRLIVAPGIERLPGSEHVGLNV